MRKSDLLIANARLVTPAGIVEGGAAVRDGKFVAIGAEDTLPDAESRIEPIPCPARYDFTESARRSDSPWL